MGQTGQDKQLLDLLLVEDNPGDVVLARHLVRRAGFPDSSIQIAIDLNGAIEMLRQHPVDVVLLDLGLPDVTGLDGVQRIQHDFPDIPIVVLTGTGDAGGGSAAIHKGAEDYILKGCIDPDLLVRTIRHAIERHKIKHELKEANAQLA